MRLSKIVPKNISKSIKMEILHCIVGKRWLLFLLLLLQIIVKHADAYCWQAGRNPGFSGEPKVEQITISRVRVSWQGIVTKRDCADNFVVKYWKEHDPSDYKMTDPLDVKSDYVDLKVTPKIEHMFEVIAREDKGAVLGIEYNRATLVKFKTSSYNRNKPPPDTGSTNLSNGLEGNGIKNEDKDVLGTVRTVIGLSIEILVIVIVLGLILLLIIIGLAYKFCCRSKSSTYDEDDEDEESGGAEDEEDDQNSTESEGLKGRQSSKRMNGNTYISNSDYVD